MEVRKVSQVQGGGTKSNRDRDRVVINALVVLVNGANQVHHNFI